MAYSKEGFSDLQVRSDVLETVSDSVHTCAVCNGAEVAMEPIIGIPDRLLSRLLYDVREPLRHQIRDFLENHFVFPICEVCIDSEYEDVRVNADEIEERYRAVLRAIHGTNRPRPGTAEVEAEIFRRLASAVEARNAA